VLDLREGRPRLYPGDYAYYLWRQENEAAEEADAAAGAAGTPPAAGSGGVEPAEGNSARRQEKQIKSRERRLQREEEEIVDRLEALHRQAAELEQSMSRQEVYQDGERMRKVKRELAETRKQEEILQSRWERLVAEQQALREGGE